MSSRISVFSLLPGILFLVAGPWIDVRAARAIEPDQLLVVVNDSSPVSVAIGNYYQGVRAIPAANIFHLPVGTPTAETISRTTYNTMVRDPIKSYLSASGLRAQVLCIVSTKGIPLRVSSGGGVSVNQIRASVDSELAMMFTGQVPDEGHSGRLGNPYFESTMSFENFRDTGSLYLATRLTGYQTNLDPSTGVPEDIKALIDRGLQPADPGVYLLDADPLAFQQGNDWLTQARDVLTDLGASVEYDGSAVFQGNVSSIRGYAGWGSNDHADPGPPYYGEVPAGSGNVYPGTFGLGALTTTFVSTSARTFTDGSQNYGQSLIADLIRHGATGCSGHVYEPFLDAVPRPQILFHRWELGYQAAEAFSMATPFASWENMIVVDPLARVAEYDPPDVTSVQPAAGPLTGGQRLTLTGSGFYGQVEVFFGTVVASQIRRDSTGSVELTVPVGPSTGAVDLTVRTPFGEDVIMGGYVYEELPPSLAIEGMVSIGSPFRFNLTGPVGAEAAILLDVRLDSTKVRSVCFDLAFSNQLRVVFDAIRGNDPVLSFPGELSVLFTVPNDPSLIFQTFFGQAVMRVPGGPFVVSNVIASSVFP